MNQAPDLTLAELALLTRRSLETLRRLCRAGSLPGVYRIGRRWMISQAAADVLRKIPNRNGGGQEVGR